MAEQHLSLASLTDDQLLARIETLACAERRSTADLIAGLVELDARRLYLGQGYSSLFAFCTKVLHLSEDAAYNRIRAARVAAKWPVVLTMVAEGSLNITAVRLLSDVLTDANHNDVLAAASHKSKREVEELIARVDPRSPVPPTIRKTLIPGVHAAATASPHAGLLELVSRATGTLRDVNPPPARPVPRRIEPLSPERYKVQFTISKTTHEKLRRVQDLMRHTNPNGDPSVIFERAPTLLLEQLEKVKLGTARHPGSPRQSSCARSRHIPASVRRAVWTRDGGRCSFIGADGRCRETGFLEYHHVLPYAEGGEATVSNIQLRCRAHNAYESEQWFGPLMARERQPRYLAQIRCHGGAGREMGSERTI